METTAIRLIMRKAIPLPFSAGSDDGRSSKILNKVFADRHENTMNKAKDKISPANGPHRCPIEHKYAMNKDIAPDIPPDINAVFAFFPIRITALIPHNIRNMP